MRCWEEGDDGSISEITVESETYSRMWFVIIILRRAVFLVVALRRDVTRCWRQNVRMRKLRGPKIVNEETIDVLVDESEKKYLQEDG